MRWNSSVISIPAFVFFDGGHSHNGSHLAGGRQSADAVEFFSHLNPRLRFL
jgi:hypothetical protein